MGRQGRPSRAILIYLLAIAAPAVVLLYLGLKSIERQREAIRTLAASNRRLSQEKLAAERERRVRQAAQQYLRNQDQAPLPHCQRRGD